MASALPNPPSTRPVAASIDADLIAGIRKRKWIDAAFAMLGLLFVLASLMVLVVLFGQLVRDGSGRIVGGHLVKPDGYAPKIRELVGSLSNEGTTDAPNWILKGEPYTLINAADLLTDSELTEFVGKQVVADGDRPAPGETRFEATKIVQAETPKPDRFSRDSIHGTLRQSGRNWIVEPSPMPLSFEDEAINPTDFDGRNVAIDVGLSRSYPLKVKSIEQLVFQGFFNSMPSSKPERAGIKSAFIGSILVVLVTMILAVPLGVASGIWLEEYGRKNWLTALIEINIANLAGIPSIVWGLMALGLLVYAFGFKRSISTAGITLGLLVLPIVIMATREAIRAIPTNIREASYACGASKWQTIRYHVLPYSMSGILTGSIIGLSRAIGETAPLITIGALTYVAFLPEFSLQNPLAWLNSGFTVLPIQMFNWVSRPDEGFQENAAAAGIVLLLLTLSMNAAAIALRYRLRKQIKW